MNRKIAFILLTILLTIACAVPTTAPTLAPVAGDPSAVTPHTRTISPNTPTFTPEPPSRPVEVQVCDGERMVALLVDPSLWVAIRSSLETFESDLCAAGYAVTENRTDFATPVELRTYLASLYEQSAGSLAGAILIGDQPHAYQYIYTVYANPNIPPSEEEVISFQFYADLDGTFRASDGYASLGGHEYSYDIHEGEMDWEIWVGVLPVYNGNLVETGEAINRYFAKNHGYRSGDYDLPQGFLEVNEHAQPDSAADDTFFRNEMARGQYSWTPLSNAADARLYYDSFSGALTTDQGYLDLAAGVGDIAVLGAHGYHLASGKIDIDWIARNGIRTVLLWSDGCSVGNLDHPENFLTSALYDPWSRVLVAKGTTNDSGGLGTNQNGYFGHNIATGIANGLSLGDALLGHVNVPLIFPWADNRELHFGTVVILGDPTLVLRP